MSKLHCCDSDSGCFAYSCDQEDVPDKDCHCPCSRCERGSDVESETIFVLPQEKEIALKAMSDHDAKWTLRQIVMKVYEGRDVGDSSAEILARVESVLRQFRI